LKKRMLVGAPTILDELGMKNRFDLKAVEITLNKYELNSRRGLLK
jgi:hypothetical protein